MISFLRKLHFWSTEVGKKSFRCFLHGSEIIKESSKDLPDMISNDIEKHINSLTELLTEYFPNLQRKNN